MAAANSSKGKKKVLTLSPLLHIGPLYFFGPACLAPDNAPCATLQKWSKGKLKEKVNNQVLMDKVRCLNPLALLSMHNFAGAVVPS